jgi:hypothetical protein
VIIIGWLLLTGFGIYITAKMMWLSQSDLELLKRNGVNGDAQAIARLAFWQEFRRFIIKVILFILGLVAFAQPDPPPVCRTANPAFGWVFVGVLYLMVILMNYSTIEALRFRSRFISNYPYDRR